MTRLSPFADVKACVFDAYGTLFDLSDVAALARPEIGVKADTLAVLWRRKQLEYAWLRSLMGRHTDFWHVTGESLDHSLKALGVRNPVLRSRLMEAWLAPKAYPDAAPALGRVQEAGFKTAILSNGSPTMLTAGVASAGLGKWVDLVLSAESVGVFKPHPSVYRLACDRLGLTAKEICFVTGNAWDAAGAAAYGFAVVWLNRTGAAPEELPARPDGEIAGLAALTELLRV